MGAVTSLFLRKVVLAAGNRVDGPALLRSVGLDPDADIDPSTMISDTAYYGMLEQIAAGLGDATDFPLHVGASMICDDYGAFGLAWKTAPTLRDSFARAERYWRLLTSVSEHEVRWAGDDAWFFLHRAGTRRLGMRLSNEATLASVMSLIRQVSEAPITAVEVHFRHPAPPTLTAHERYFGCPAIFGSDRDALLLPGAVLSRPNRQGDTGITRFLLQHLDAELDKLGTDRSLGQTVRGAIAQALSAGVPKAAEVAARLGISERTLQRRLGEEGLSFQKLVDEARRELAEGLLAERDYALAEIAFLTGFSGQSAFTRAFRRWRNETPAAYRAAQKG
ncbi:Transcriptional regulator, AraC family [Rhodovulum sp. P5]|uniref:AraC family transcriptional regulator n=1 Tax=Rhodovulum sp. P5 TaxID=1564506 RepID=UPI0009C26BA3|nr:AraC family transcriptional regulator [Rhodovulum sp. P5]ARE39701.1 Transcriptional regulator, AraC family [Rhodovulum sp. P5]